MRTDNCKSDPLLSTSLADLQVARAATNAANQDEQILQQVIAALFQTGYAQLRSVQSYCHHGRVVLQGRISTDYLKRMALDVVRNLPNVKEVDNDLRVVCGR